MKDLQELFESIGADEVNNLAQLIDKKSLNPKSVKKVLDYISIVYCGEMGVDEAELNTGQIDKLYESFTMSVALYANILKGDMEIVQGRIKLTDGNACKFTLTKQGIESVEKMLNL